MRLDLKIIETTVGGLIQPHKLFSSNNRRLNLFNLWTSHKVRYKQTRPAKNSQPHPSLFLLTSSGHSTELFDSPINQKESTSYWGVISNWNHPLRSKDVAYQGRKRQMCAYLKKTTFSILLCWMRRRHKRDRPLFKCSCYDYTRPPPLKPCSAFTKGLAVIDTQSTGRQGETNHIMLFNKRFLYRSSVKVPLPWPILCRYQIS